MARMYVCLCVAQSALLSLSVCPSSSMTPSMTSSVSVSLPLCLSGCLCLCSYWLDFPWPRYVWV